MKGWKQLPFGAALLIGLEAAALAQLALALGWAERWTQFATLNEVGRLNRSALVAITAGAGLFAVFTSIALTLFKPAWSGGFKRGGTLALPLLALWTVPTLVRPQAFE